MTSLKPRDLDKGLDFLSLYLRMGSPDDIPNILYYIYSTSVIKHTLCDLFIMKENGNRVDNL